MLSSPPRLVPEVGRPRNPPVLTGPSVNGQLLFSSALRPAKTPTTRRIAAAGGEFNSGAGESPPPE
eukprot:9068618-Pyramimonas_sp.AAC.1